MTSTVPVPPDEAFDEEGNYKRELDRRLNEVIKPVPGKFDGYLPVFCPERLAITLSVSDGNDRPNCALEIELPAHEFDRVSHIFNGGIVQLQIRSVRAIRPTMELVPPALTNLSLSTENLQTKEMTE